MYIMEICGIQADHQYHTQYQRAIYRLPLSKYLYLNICSRPSLFEYFIYLYVIVSIFAFDYLGQQEMSKC